MTHTFKNPPTGVKQNNERHSNRDKYQQSGTTSMMESLDCPMPIHLTGKTKANQFLKLTFPKSFQNNSFHIKFLQQSLTTENGKFFHSTNTVKQVTCDFARDQM